MNNAPAPSSKSLFGAGLLAALAASLCCITPLLAVVGGSAVPAPSPGSNPTASIWWR